MTEEMILTLLLVAAIAAFLIITALACAWRTYNMFIGVGFSLSLIALVLRSMSVLAPDTIAAQMFGGKSIFFAVVGGILTIGSFVQILRGKRGPSS